MFFEFQKYVQPIWYFNLEPAIGRRWIKVNKSDTQDNESFQNKESYECNRLWEAYFTGMGLLEDMTLEYFDKVKDIPDNYIFIKKHFHPIWLGYIFFIRILSLKNPLKEWNGIRSAWNVKRVVISKDSNGKNDSPITGISKYPKVTVIIPTLNRYRYLKDVLKDLVKQNYDNFNVIVVDQSDPFKEEFYRGYDIDLTIIRQEEKLLWKARNTAIRQTDADLILLYDDDSRVEENWISHHFNCIVKYKSDVSSGISISKVGDKIPENYKEFRLSDQLDTGNVMIKKEVFEKVGLFDEQFEKQRMGDGEFGLRVYLAGFKNISNPNAKRLHLKVPQGGLRQMGHWDAFRPKGFLKPRPIPSVLYYSRRYFGNKASLYYLLKNIPPSIIPLEYKHNRLLFVIGSIFSLLISPYILLQIIISWSKSSKMISVGPKVQILDQKIHET